VFGLRIFGRASIVKLQEITDKAAMGIRDLRSPTMDGGPGLWDLYRPVWHSSRRRMYRTRGAYTGVTWPRYQTEGKQSERRYVAIKASIYREAGRNFDSTTDLLRWMRGSERLYPSLAVQGHPLNVYRPGRRSLTVGTRLNYARRLGRGGSIPRRLGGGRHPARPMLELGGTAALDLRRVVAGYVIAHEEGMTARYATETVTRTAGLRR
jgi:hypothetical protein